MAGTDNSLGFCDSVSCMAFYPIRCCLFSRAHWHTAYTVENTCHCLSISMLDTLNVCFSLLIIRLYHWPGTWQGSHFRYRQGITDRVTPATITSTENSLEHSVKFFFSIAFHKFRCPLCAWPHLHTGFRNRHSWTPLPYSFLPHTLKVCLHNWELL